MVDLTLQIAVDKKNDLDNEERSKDSGPDVRRTRESGTVFLESVEGLDEQEDGYGLRNPQGVEQVFLDIDQQAVGKENHDDADTLEKIDEVVVSGAGEGNLEIAPRSVGGERG